MKRWRKVAESDDVVLPTPQMFLVDNLSRKVDFMQAQPNLSVCLSLNVSVRGKSFEVENLIRPFQNHQKLKYILSIRCVATSETI